MNGRARAVVRARAMLPRGLMSTTRTAAAAFLAAGAFLGCTKEPAGGPAQQAPGGPASSVGQTEAQPRPTGGVELPPGTWLREARAAGRAADRIYETDLTYEHAVVYFDHATPERCEKASRISTDTATFWSLRCPDGETTYVAIRSTLPTTIEILGGT
jgi:hypothetical protein